MLKAGFSILPISTLLHFENMQINSRRKIYSEHTVVSPFFFFRLWHVDQAELIQLSWESCSFVLVWFFRTRHCKERIATPKKYGSYISSLWRRGNARNFSFIIFFCGNFTPTRLILNFITDAAPQLLKNLSFCLYGREAEASHLGQMPNGCSLVFRKP